MRYAAETRTLVTEGALEVHRSSIASSRKMIRMTIADNYSDPELAVVRELATNAADSHRRAGNEGSFYVHCPTNLKPEFFVRDSGVGMTHEKMKDTYIVIGASDKDGADDETGMWGVGALAPFAKADQYYITCFDGETARHYGFGMADDGFPTLVLMGEEPCDEPRGVRVGLSVEEKDFPKFEQAIQKVALGFGSQLETNISLKAIGEVAYSGEDWAAHLGCPLTARWNVRQGGVIYPLDRHKVGFPEDYKLTFILDCPIGTVQVTPSREPVAYTEEVITYLNGRITTVQEAIRTSIVERVKDIENVVEFFSTVSKLKPSFLTGPFTHEPTGLTGPEIRSQAPQVFFSAVLDQQGRWTFNTLTHLNLTDTVKHGSALMIEDITPFLDPSRDTNALPTSGRDWLSQSELRRLSRLTRSFLDANNLNNALFLFNTDYSEEFWHATVPHMKRVPLTLDEIRAAIPKRIAPPPNAQRQTIKGIALAKAAGEQRPVFEIVPRQDDKLVAWVTSDQYRKGGGTLFALARRFEIAALYIVAPTVTDLMTQHCIPPLKAAIDAALANQGATFEHWYASKSTLDHYSFRNLASFLKALRRADGNAFEAFSRTRGNLGKIAKAMSPRLDACANVTDMTEEEKSAIDLLLVDGTGKQLQAPAPMELADLTELTNGFKDNYYHPLVRFFEYAASCRSKDHICRAAQAALQMEKLFPLSERIKI